MDKEGFLSAMKKQLQKGYVEVVLAVVGLFAGLYFVFSPYEFVAMVGRKAGLCGLATAIWYVVRLTRLGTIDWSKEPWDKVYALVLLLAYALIIALG
jgi:membrane associated rhomboid family serine protease